MKWTRRVLLKNGRLAFGAALAVAAAGGLLFYRLGTLTHGISGSEAALLQHGVSLSDIYQNPLNLPLKFLQWLCIGIIHTHHVWLLRLPSAIFGAAALAIFIFLLKRWYGTRTAVFGSALFACSPWFLHASRLTSVDALQLFAVLMIMFTLVHLGRDYMKAWAFYGSAIVLSLLLYVPGVVWFVAAGLMLQFFDIKEGLKRFSLWWQRALYVVSWLAPLALLITAFVHNPSLWRSWLALPAQFAAPIDILKHIGTTMLAFVWQGPGNPAMWLDRMPILNAFVIIMVIVGAYFYACHLLAPRTRLLFIFFITSIVLVALGGLATLSFTIPIVYVVAAAGIGYLLHEWLSVFPRNPLARAAGIILITATLCLSCLYGVRSYFVAWPHNHTTQAAFHPVE